MAASPVEPLNFNRDILPVLSDNCFSCHGPDGASREAELRLDREQSAKEELPSGVTAIVPRDVEASELVARITAADSDMRMPPRGSNKSLSREEIARLRRWVAEGAPWEKHWSFVSPEQPPAPAVKQEDWVRRPLDRFVLAKLEAAGLSPAREADRPTLVRRLYLDAIGLPPTLEQLDVALADSSSQWYERLVDRLLASPHFGERLTQDWLDVARYGDTNGFHYDSDREMWLYRDAVIEAFNDNMPYDQFTIEQLAGDLLESPNERQLILTGFHRNTPFNEEGGADAEEYLSKYAVDRASTTGTVWLGLTVGCAECHDHKYDAITQKDFYSLYAFFNSVEGELGAQGHNTPLPPILNILPETQKKAVAKITDRIDQSQAEAQQLLSQVEYTDPVSLADARAQSAKQPEEFIWVEDGLPEGASPIGATWRWAGRYAHPVFSGRYSMQSIGGEGIRRHHFISATNRAKLTEESVLFAHVWLDPQDPPEEIMLEFRYGLSTTWGYRAYWGDDKINLGEGTSHVRVGDLPKPGHWTRIEVKASELKLPPGAELSSMVLSQFGGAAYWDRVGVTSPAGASSENVSPSLPSDRERQPEESQRDWEQMVLAARLSQPPQDVFEAVRIPEAKRTSAQQKIIRQHYLRRQYGGTRDLFADFDRRLDELRRQWRKEEQGGSPTMIMQEAPTRRKAYVLQRGDFQSPGEEVQPGVPESLNWEGASPTPDRLALARWLVDEKNPLTARVMVNRLWQQFFGVGIVKTANDFGVQGEAPSHPQLLDSLAMRFMHSGWDIKATVKEMLMSATYRQDSTYRREMAEIDPYNRLLHRGPRFRVPAEQVRDIALTASGLLNPQVGGPSVMPFQPEAYYVGKREDWQWNVSEGEQKYRRGLYTFWRRTTLYPSFQIFDAPSREVCTVTRPRTITPLQSLVQLNDPVFVEAARALADRVIEEGAAAELQDQLRFAFRQVTSHEPTMDELTVLTQAWRAHEKHFSQHPEAARQLCQASPGVPSAANRAAWITVANSLLCTEASTVRE